MKVYNFSSFMKSRKINENSDLDWSDKNWTDRDTEGVNPPNSGFEGTGAEPMDYFAGDYGETSEKDDDETPLDSENTEKNDSDITINSIKAMIDDLTIRVNNLSRVK